MAFPPSVRRRSHKLRSMCRSRRMRLAPERQDLNTAGRRAFPPSRPGEPAGFPAPGCLVYFYKRCLSSKCRLSCNFGSSIRLCVCLLLSGGGKRLRLLTASTDRGRAARYSSTRATCITSRRGEDAASVRRILRREEELPVVNVSFGFVL